MKKCRRCSKLATLHITEIRDGDTHELHLCESCAHDYLTPSESSHSEDEAAAFSLKLTDKMQLEELDQIICPSCGTSFREFRSQGRLGCPHDYVAFEAELLPLLENIHGETQHCGKLPCRAPDGSQQQYRLIKLRNELRTAVEQEEYEDAARLRDEIEVLKSDPNDETD